MSLQLWFGFVCTATIAILYPGPTMLTVTSYSLAYNRPSYATLLAAIALGDATALALSFLGLGLLETSGFWLVAVNFVSGLYLLYFGVKRLRTDASPERLNVPPTSHSRRLLFTNTFLVTGLNPKSIPLLLVLLDGFIDKGGNVTRQRVILAVTFVTLSLGGAALYMVFAASARKLIASPRAQRRFRIAGGLLLTAAGTWALARSLFAARAYGAL